MNELQIFKNELFEVGAKVENETILFDAEQVARCLGIVSKTSKNGKEYVNVRWSRVNEFLPQVAETIGQGSLIPEPFVYKLAFKASNEIAEQFQDWLAVEVLPQIRKTGAYTTNSMELALQAALDHEREIKVIKTDVDYLKNNMRIDGVQQQEIQATAKQSIIHALGGKESIAYKEISKKAFSAFWNEFKQYFKVPRYGDLPKMKMDEAIRFIELWRPSTSLQMEIDSCNSQMVFG